MEPITSGGPRGMSRRDMLKRGAVLGGAAVWITPTLQVLGVGRQYAHAASGPTPTTPTTANATTTTTAAAAGKGISFAAFRFSCNGTVYFAKIEGNGLATCEGPNRGQNCDVDSSGAVSGCGLGLYTTVNTLTGGELTKVVVTLTCPGGQFLAARLKAGKDCIAATIVGPVATFQS